LPTSVISESGIVNSFDDPGIDESGTSGSPDEPDAPDPPVVPGVSPSNEESNCE
jgi:hypothetical protein